MIIKLFCLAAAIDTVQVPGTNRVLRITVVVCCMLSVC